MNGEIKCPKCKGDKFSYAGENAFKCAYCGTVFHLPKPEPATQPVAPQPQPEKQVVVNVQIPQQPISNSADTTKQRQKNLQKGCLHFVGVYFVVMLVLYLLQTIFFNRPSIALAAFGAFLVADIYFVVFLCWKNRNL